jgi:hypothetical protein
MASSCKNCKFAKFQLTEKGNIKRSLPGRCIFKVVIPKLPDAVKNHYSFRRDGEHFGKSCIRPNDGIDCETFEDKNGEK